MKKIVGILSAAAVLAGSVFAADVAANAKLASTLFNYDDGAVKVLDTLNNDATADYKSLFTLAVSSDNAGGKVCYYGNADGSEKLTFANYSVWFKPADILKLSFRENGLDPFADKFHGYNANGLPAVGAGYGITLTPSDALTISVNLGDGPFVNKPKEGDATVGELGAKIGYTADFGSIAVIADFKDTFKTMAFGAGFSGTFGDVGVVFNAGVALGDSTTIKVNPSAGGSVDAISWAIDVPVAYTNEVSVGLNALAGYKLDNGVGFTFKYEDANLIGDFDGKFTLEVAGSVGAASWKVAPSFATATKVFNVALETGIGF